MNKYLKTCFCAALMFTGMGCSDWLDVEPLDRVTEEQLYSTEDGFKKSLNGIYVDLNSPALYGGELLVNTVEILAQRYKFSNDREMQGQSDLCFYDFESNYAKNCVTRIWEKGYSLIANINVLLRHAEADTAIFTGNNYNLLTGEAYALRAMLHFDLLRVFGPVYSRNKDAESICYNSAFNLSASDLLPASKVIEYVLKDLKTAEERLADDPVLTEGPMMSNGNVDEDIFTRYRSLRLNYFAVKALQARVYLYAGRKEEALEAAREVVAVQPRWFPFMKYTDIVGESRKPNRVFSPELLFALQNSKRSDIFTNYFSPDLQDNQMYLTPNSYLQEVFGPFAKNDRRYEPIWLNTENHENRCFYKYAKIESTSLYSKMIPMLRVTEMYYIIAEASDDDEEAVSSMNLVLENRGLPKLSTRKEVDDAIMGEYQREFWGEGQLFFYYKRIYAESILSAAIGRYIPMNESRYVLPLPESETNFR